MRWLASCRGEPAKMHSACPLSFAPYGSQLEPGVGGMAEKHKGWEGAERLTRSTTGAQIKAALCIADLENKEQNKTPND